MSRFTLRCWLELAFAGLIISGVAPSATAQQTEKTQPHDVAVYAGHAITTSLGSDYISVHYDGYTEPRLFYVGAPSWGVCFADSVAYVTLPDTTFIAVVDLSDSLSADARGLITVPRGCTEVISDSAGEAIYVANVGKSTATAFADQWQHSVLKFDLSESWTPTSEVATFPTERQPRSLALCPRDSILFVGTVQGAFGQTGLGTPETSAADGFYSPYDGGSVVTYEADDLSPSALARIPVGSPVRGLAVLDGQGYDSPNSGYYRIYFTNVGYGVQSEDPDHGGRGIPNVISSVLVDSVGDPVSRQDVVFDHRPETNLDGTESGTGLPAVLPEKLIVRPYSSKGGYAAELWITNSASGTVSRAWIEKRSGKIAVHPTQTAEVTFPKVTDVERASETFAYSFEDVTINYPKVDPADHVRTDPEATSPFRSRPRGIAYDAGDDEILIVTESLAQLVAIDATDSILANATATFVTLGEKIDEWDFSVPINHNKGGGEGNFFTFGEGFGFREVAENGGDMVDNLSCGTCHVDGHTDGKVRRTVMKGDNLIDGGDNGERRAVVAVPSVRDAENSEWLFFEGQVTVVDARDAEGAEPCGYCLTNDFFRHTIGFTPTTSWSPYAEGEGELSYDEQKGRALFDDLNCSRCHNGRDDWGYAVHTFARSNDSDANNGDHGPLKMKRGILSDPTQVFISNVPAGDIGDPLTSADDVSLRNMTVVGTRVEDTTGPSGGSSPLNPIANSHVPGVNTPALAGAWDNAPYMHDGRYRTLDDVLKSTWVSETHGDRAARRWNKIGPPDNLLDEENFHLTRGSTWQLNRESAVPSGTRTPGKVWILDAPTGAEEVALYDFETHSPSNPGSSDWTSVYTHLGAGDYAHLLDFINALSSRLDPYPLGDPDVDSLRAIVTGPGSATVKWNTPRVAVCRYEVTNDSTSQTFSGSQGPAEAFSVAINTSGAPAATWSVTVTTCYNGLWEDFTETWSAVPQFTNESQNTGALTVDELATPAAALALDYNEDGYEDLLVSYADDFAALFKNRGSDAEVASFDVRTTLDLGGNTLDTSKGAATADVDGDGHLDLFVAAADSNRLFIGDGTDFGTDHSALLGDAKTLCAVGGSFGDYNGDHWIDLYLMAGSTAAGNMLLENCAGDSLTDVTVAAGLDSAIVGSTSAVWADLNDDDRMDLVVGWGAAVGTSDAEWSTFYVNQGPDANGQWTFDDAAGDVAAPTIPKLGHVNALELADVDGDGDLDVLCATDDVSSSDNLVVWLNDGAGGLSAASSSLGLDTDTRLIDVEVSDLTGNGILDVVAVPVPTAPDTILVFSAIVPEEDWEYTDVSSVVDLGADPTYGVIAADFNRDTDADLFLLRPETGDSGDNEDQKFFWANALVDSASASGEEVAFTVELGVDATSTNPNPRATGAVVISTVETPGGETLVTSQVVDGGSGHGSQGAGRLVFGLGGASTADVTVIWPSGASQIFAAVDTMAGWPHIKLVDTSNPTIVAASMSASYTLDGSGGITHEYTWKTRHRCDSAKVKLFASRVSACNGEFGGQDDLTLDPSDSDVTWTQVQDGDDWQQTLEWDATCAANCSYDYKVKSVVGGTTYTGAEKTISIGACVIIVP